MVRIAGSARRRLRAALPLSLVVLAATGSTARAAELHAAWTGDFASVVDGGVQRGERHMGLVELAFDHVFAIAQRDVTLYVAGQHVYGGGFSEEWVGDLQTVSNVDADRGTRVLEAWLDVPLTDTLSMRVGRYDFNSEFDAVDPAGLFLHSSHGIGPDISQTGAAGPSIFPRTALAVRLQCDFEGDHAVRGVALDLESESDGDVPFFEGPMFALEYEFGPGGTLWKAGAWGFTRSRESLAAPDDRDREYGAYASVQHRIAGSWVGYARVGMANEDVSRLGSYAGAGLVHQGGLLSTRADTVGIAVAHARNGDAYRAAMREDGTATTAAETAVELTWRVPLGEHVVLQPDVQYVFDPDTNPAIDDAFVVMLRVELQL
ncbi:MAG TPA: carbohydrate porin [Steroidobacteraceae bacterium]|nr:carbohydrate porin [Steroidobacteraceae bacterium]